MKYLVRAATAVLVSVLMLLGATSPVAASPSDPQTVDELRASLAYRAEHADVLRLYRAFFERDPDIGGALYWISVYEDGASLDDLAWGFSNSTEFMNTYGSSIDDAAFLTIVYSNVLGRDPDPVGFNYWLGIMQDGLGRAGVVRWVAANDEFINAFPYSDVSPDLGTALLTSGDMPAGWVRNNNSGRGADDGSCLNMFRFAESAELSAFYSDINYGPFANHALYSYATVAGAEAFIQELRDRLGRCSTSIDFSGWTTTREVMTYPSLGDDTLAVRVVDTHTSSGTVYISEIVVVRYGSSVSGIRHHSFDSVSTVLTQQLVSLTTGRLIDLAGP